MNGRVPLNRDTLPLWLGLKCPQCKGFLPISEGSLLFSVVRQHR